MLGKGLSTIVAALAVALPPFAAVAQQQGEPAVALRPVGVQARAKAARASQINPVASC